MSHNWIRGSRCGTDNCRTHFYKIIDGQRICQYGHVYEGYNEFNDEEDDAYVVTRRLTIPSASQYKQSQISSRKQKNPDEEVLYGEKGRELLLKCFQTVLKIQVKEMITKFNAPEIFETIVKKIWLDYLTNFLSTNNNKKDNTYKFEVFGSVINNISILYLACRYLQLPIFLGDFIQWISTNELTYMKGSSKIPSKLLKRLPHGLHLKVDPSRIPLNGQLCLSISKIASAVNLPDLRLNYEPLLLKTMNSLILPPRIYRGVKEFIKLNEDIFNLGFTIGRTSTITIYEFPEIRFIAIVIVVTKLYFINSHNAPNIPNYKIWLTILQDMNSTNSKNFDNVLSSLLTAESSDCELLEWEENDTNRYLDWFQKTFVATTEFDDANKNDKESIAMRRLFDLFELEENEEEKLDKDDRDELQEQAIAAEIHKTDIGFKHLLKDYNTSLFANKKQEKISERGLAKIQKIFMDNFVPGLGVNAIQLENAIKLVENYILRTDTLSELTQNRK